MISLIINYSLHFLDLPSHPFPCKYGVDLLLGGIFGIPFIIARPLMSFVEFSIFVYINLSTIFLMWPVGCSISYVWYRSLIIAL